MTLELLGPEHLVEILIAYRDALVDEQAVLNRLNVFPVPDGDTGTNMLLTVESVVAALESGDRPGDLAGLASMVGRAALMGARGNSGVILCQVLRGLATRLAASEKVAGADLADALVQASAAARAAVMQPAEGTILSVAAAAAAAAAGEVETASAAGTSATLLAVAGASRLAAVEALWRTPEQLPVLRSAGVVDAGGAGLVLLFDAALQVVDGRPLPGLALPEEVRRVVAGGGAGVPGAAASGGAGVKAPAAGTRDEAAAAGARDEAPAAGARDEAAAAGARDEAAGTGAAMPGSCRYEVMYLLEAPDESIPAFKEVWAGLGESIVVVGGDGLWSCHIHTDEIGAAVEAALDAGRPREIRVTDLAEQVEEESWVREEAARSGQPETEAPGDDLRATHVVAVANGDGIRRILRSLGASAVVAGGQSMNPSTAEVLAAIEGCAGEGVVVLPNNANIVPVAREAAALSGKHVVVVATRAIQEGFAALMEYDPQASSEENATRMAEAAGRVTTGEVTRAVRASDSPAGAVAAGDFIGIGRSGIVAVSSDLANVTCRLLAALLRSEHELVTLFEGAGASAAATRLVSEWLAANHPGVELERHVGGQPLYPYLVTVE